MTETIINMLSALSGLRVMARSTIFRFRNIDMDVRAVGVQLGVESVLTGRIMHVGDHLRISAELVDVNSGWQLWGAQYNRPLSDIFVLQDEIASEITNNLNLRINKEERATLAKRHTRNLDAYKLYLKGRHCWNKRSEQQIRAAIGYFEQAIAADRNYALAYVGLADCYATLSLFFSEPPTDTMSKAHRLAAKALDLDKGLAEAHASVGMITLRYGLDAIRAAKELQRAIDLNPGYPVAHHWYGECLAAMGRSVESIEELKRAQDLDPLSAITSAVLAGMYYFACDYGRAIEEAHKSLELEDNFWPALLFLGLAHEQEDHPTEAVDSLLSGVRAANRNALLLASLGHAYGQFGDFAAAQQISKELDQASRVHYVSPVLTALVALGLEDRELAMAGLTKALDERSGWLYFAGVDPRFSPLHADSRFSALTSRINGIKTN